MMSNYTGIDSAIAESPQSAEPSFGLSTTRYSDDGTDMFEGMEA